MFIPTALFALISNGGAVSTAESQRVALASLAVRLLELLPHLCASPLKLLLDRDAWKHYIIFHIHQFRYMHLSLPVYTSK